MFVLLNIHEMKKLEQMFFMLVKFYLAPQILFFSKEQNTYFSDTIVFCLPVSIVFQVEMCLCGDNETD